MKKSELYVLNRTIDSFRGIPNISKTFLYVLLKNKKKIQDEIEIIEGTLSKFDEEESKVYSEWSEKKAKLIKDGAEKDENGNTILIGGNSLKIENPDEFKEKLDELNEEYKEILDRLEELNKENAEILDSEIELELEKIPWDFIPENILQEQLEALFDLIEEPE